MMVALFNLLKGLRTPTEGSMGSTPACEIPGCSWNGLDTVHPGQETGLTDLLMASASSITVSTPHLDLQQGDLGQADQA